jgi:hypothetical protein
MNEKLWRELVAAGLSESKEAPEILWLQGVLPILVVPRVLNMALLASLVGRFAPAQAEASGLAYITWISRINEFADNLLLWNLKKVGYTFRSDIREIILGTVRRDASFPLLQIHAFVAELREGYALTSATDAPRHLTEMLYHLLLSGQPPTQEQVMAKITALLSDKAPLLALLREDSQLKDEPFIIELIRLIEAKGGND